VFTGLVQGVARIEQVERRAADGGVRLTVDARDVPGFAAAAGDSIALAGACMTATAVEGTRFTVDVSAESLSRTVGLDARGEVNVETSLRLGDRLGGHMVAGHVDGVGEVLRFAPVAESWELVVRAPRALGRYLAAKGSVTVDGVSLTVNRVADAPAGCEFSINIIPHTHAVTTLRNLRPGSRVNLEADLIARYVERMLSPPAGAD
jgi:riboflavin synthase